MMIIFDCFICLYIASINCSKLSICKFDDGLNLFLPLKMNLISNVFLFWMEKGMGGMQSCMLIVV